VPAERLAALRAAFEATMKDAEFIKLMREKINQRVTAQSGTAFQAYVERSIATPQDIVEAVNKIIR
jgi:tripartite-type tricarboxylate transporter receptor subunit TctC